MAVTVLLATGCGASLYGLAISRATSKLEAADTIGAERLAPYEYHFAREHWLKAQEEAARADYGDAATFANIAEEYADKAIVSAKQAHEGSGR